jgi:hypothetical protein
MSSTGSIGYTTPSASPATTASRAPLPQAYLFAEEIERLLARKLGVDWSAYEKAVSSKWLSDDCALTPVGYAAPGGAPRPQAIVAEVLVRRLAPAGYPRSSCYGPEPILQWSRKFLPGARFGSAFNRVGHVI